MTRTIHWRSLALVGFGMALACACSRSPAPNFNPHDPRWFQCDYDVFFPSLRMAGPLTVRTSPATNSPACTLTAGDLLDLGTETDEAVSAMQVAFAWPVTVRLSASCDDGGRVYWVEPYQVFLAAQPGWWVQEMVWGWELGGSR